MKKVKFQHAEFISSAVSEKGFPRLLDLSGHPMIEIAVAGRSNVGKSSLINHLFRQGKMAKTSATPGKTQQINFFTVDNCLAFVDLPGYGYAKVSKQLKASWGNLVHTYLEKRKNLKMVLFLFDIRRVPQEDDRMFMQWMIQNNLAILLILTKTDKVSRSQQNGYGKKILDKFDCENLHSLFYSVTKNIGRKELIALINQALEGEDGKIDP